MSLQYYEGEKGKSEGRYKRWERAGKTVKIVSLTLTAGAAALIVADLFTGYLTGGVATAAALKILMANKAAAAAAPLGAYGFYRFAEREKRGWKENIKHWDKVVWARKGQIARGLVED